MIDLLGRLRMIQGSTYNFCGGGVSSTEIDQESSISSHLQVQA